ncbi:Retrovirus-related Pol polyprotein from transposon TNT 1-94 [Vitis vinifera]|uniref:Retrovirus-related Pol polyprotein from transposon TNT 1-94 n=1 Tax=Vitis vinifera TaxID=29760 RepID=A0A438CRP9_VITVI|nr:Retrovirus-related Pol polyprotein from transposon TNT 1-94 [Vitis vinifera]
MVQHFDHVLHHLTSAAIKEHVPPTAQHGGKRQRGLMEVTVINFFRKWSRTHSAIIFRKTPSKKREIRVWKSGFLKPTTMAGGHYRRSKDAIFWRSSSAIKASFSGAPVTPFQAPFRRVEVPFFGATTSAVQALLLGVVQAPFKAHLSHHLSAVQAPLETPFFFLGCKSYFTRRVEALQTASWLGLHPARVQSTWVAARTSLPVLKQSTKWQKNRILVLPSISDIRCEVPELRGDNFKIWKERILLQLGCMDIDYAIRKDEPHKITDTSTPEQILLYERWEKSNRLSVMYIKTKISADKALASTLIMKFTSLKLTGIRGVREHIMEMRDIVAQLKKLEVEMSESFLVHFILNTLPLQYGPFKISYNTHKDKWSINELMTMCVQEEGRLLMEQGESAMLVTQRKGKKGKSQASQKGKQQISPKSDIKKDEKCFFCKKKGHVKKKCLKFQNWLEKKETSFSLIYKSECVGNGILSDGLYCIFLQNDTAHNSLHVQTGIKRCVVKEDSSTLWHRRLGHISTDRIKRLVNDGVLSTLDFTDFETCVDCIKGKQTNKSKRGATRSSTILEIIHTDICSLDMDSHGQKYFISFIDDFSRYMYLYILHNKNEALDAFKVFKAEVEKQYGKQIKIVRSDRGGEYYGRYLEDGQSPGPFAKFLQEHGIVAQYTMPGSPDQNGVAERRNRTVLDMVRSMLSSSKLPKFL